MTKPLPGHWERTENGIGWTVVDEEHVAMILRGYYNDVTAIMDAMRKRTNFHAATTGTVYRFVPEGDQS